MRAGSAKSEKAKKMGWMNPPNSFTKPAPGDIVRGGSYFGESRIVRCKSHAGKKPGHPHARI
jgi:hypothetical protein